MPCMDGLRHIFSHGSTQRYLMWCEFVDRDRIVKRLQPFTTTDYATCLRCIAIWSRHEPAA